MEATEDAPPRTGSLISRAKAIGPFDGNNNNDGDLLFGSLRSPDDGGPDSSSGDFKTNKEEYNQSLKMTRRSSQATTPLASPVAKHREAKYRPSQSSNQHSQCVPIMKTSTGSLATVTTSLSSEIGALVVNDGFDVYNMESAMPKIDWETMEAHLRAAREEEKRRRNDREEIRKRLAMGIECDDVVIDTKKPSLHSRLQSGMNLQICFMNETASDGSDSEKGNGSEIVRDPYLSLPVVSKLNHSAVQQQQTSPKDPEMDFFTQQSKLQVEARKSLAQAKELARVQMQVERQQKKRSLISDLVRQSLEKLGLPFTWDCRRLSRQILTELNVAQLQVIVNDLHTQIEGLNEELVQMLLKRDDFHMEQDSMLVDIEDLTRYLTAKQTMSIPSSADFPQESGPVSLPVQKSNAQSPKQRLRSFRISGLRK